MALDITTGAKILKVKYPEKVVANLAAKDNPALAWIPKDKTFYGKNLTIPVTHAHSPARSKTFATALANKSSQQFEEFVVTRVYDYAIGSITREMMLVSKVDAASFERGLDVEMRGAIEALSESLERNLFGDGANEIGQIKAGSDLTSDTITLVDPADAFKFEVGMKLVAAASRASGSIRTGSVTVESIDPDTGTITTTAHWDDSISSVATGDYLFVQGDRNTATLLGVQGFRGWIPDTAPTSGDSFFSLDRSVNPAKLAGNRVDLSSSGASSLQKVQEGLLKMAKWGADVDTIFVPYEVYTDVALELGASKVLSTLDISDVGVGFEAIMIANGKGKGAKLVAAPACPTDRAYCLNRDSWTLYSAGEAVSLQNENGQLLTEASSDGFEFRVSFYGNAVCNNPRKNGVILL